MAGRNAEAGVGANARRNIDALGRNLGSLFPSFAGEVAGFGVIDRNAASRRDGKMAAVRYAVIRGAQKGRGGQKKQQR